jgi:hypothetical protein
MLIFVPIWEDMAIREVSPEDVRFIDSAFGFYVYVGF